MEACLTAESLLLNSNLCIMSNTVVPCHFLYTSPFAPCFVSKNDDTQQIKRSWDVIQQSFNSHLPDITVITDASVAPQSAVFIVLPPCWTLNLSCLHNRNFPCKNCFSTSFFNIFHPCNDAVERDLKEMG